MLTMSGAGGLETYYVTQSKSYILLRGFRHGLTNAAENITDSQRQLKAPRYIETNHEPRPALFAHF